jgi:hypothetical protein
MSLVTHAMTKNAPQEAAPPLMNRNACINGLTLNNIFKPSAFGQAETLFPTHVPFAHGQPWGQPWMPYSTAAMPSVDVPVSSSTTAGEGVEVRARQIEVQV